MFSRKKLAKTDKTKNVIFEINAGSDDALSCKNREGLFNLSQDLIFQEQHERVVAPLDRFELLLGDEEEQPEVFVPADMHHYDEQDYRDHRHHAYPHVHQPLKSMEPRVLMKIKTRIKASKRAEERAAKAGVTSNVPSLLANTCDTRVLIDTGKGVSGPILTIVRDESQDLNTQVARKRRKRKRKRSKKQEPFQPTLCKLSEESSSPLHNTTAEEGDDNCLGGLVLEELNDAMKRIKSDTFTSTSVSRTPSITAISFLDEIASMDLPIGYLDLTHQCHTTRQHSLPFFENVDRVEKTEDIITSQSVADLKKPIKNLKFILPIDDSFHELSPLITFNQESSEIESADSVKFIRSTSSGQIAISATTHPQKDFNNVNLNQVASTSAITSESCIKISNCNFQIGSVDSVIVPPQDTFNADMNVSCNRDHEDQTEYSNDSSINSCYQHRHHHHHHKEHYNKRDLEKRTFSGQDMRSLWQSKDNKDVDESESMLGDAIIDDMRNHRCHDMPALNRTRIRYRCVHSNSNSRVLHRSRSVSHSRAEGRYSPCRKTIQKCITCGDETGKSDQYTKSQQDLIFQANTCQAECNSSEFMEENPYPLFVEMDILKPHKYWREISRWVRYEQCYNELSETFGKAHSSPLKFTAFTQFRVQLEDAIFLPDVVANSFDEAVSLLTEELILAQLFTEPRDSIFVKEVFKWKHIHAGEKISNDEDEWDQMHCESTNNLFEDANNDLNMRLINTSPGNFNNTLQAHSFSTGATKISFDHLGTNNTDVNLNNKYGQHSNFPSMIKMLKNSFPILRHSKYHKSDLEGHLPVGTEGVTVQVGALDSLKKPFLAIMRFKNHMYMDRVIELNLPIRFLIVCLGPSGKIQYEELGRVISSMLINKDFCKLMYRATEKCEIIQGLYKYLDTCFVLSYSGSHPTKNMHTMIDHISDFVRNEGGSSVYSSAHKDNETKWHSPKRIIHQYPKDEEETAQLLNHEDGIKHSVSVDKTHELRSHTVRHGDSARFDNGFIGDSKREKVIFEQPEFDLESGKDLDVDTHDHINQKSKIDINIIKSSLSIRSQELLPTCYGISFFLFRLLRLDILKYKDRFVSDFVDAFIQENIAIVLSGLVYLYLVCLCPALTFGVLLGDLVSNEFNVQVVLVCTGFLTILFAIIGGNPLLVIGITGPMFLMETVIAKMALNFNLPIMLYRFVIAVYVSVIGLLSLALNITWVMQKVRRSVEECFNGFVGLYFIFKAGLTIFRIFPMQDPRLYINGSDLKSSIPSRRQNLIDNPVAEGFASLVLAYSMYQICMVLNSVNRGRFFTRKFRTVVDYFNVAIGILVVSFINFVIMKMLPIHLPNLGTEINATSWIKFPPIFLIGNTVSIGAHMIAFLLAIALLSLIFTETAISGITVTKAEKKVVKSSLFAQDQLLSLCILPLLCGSFCWPFVSGAAVRSTSHIMAMTKWDQKVIPGVKHKILGVVEQRVTMLVVGGCLLATVSIQSALRYVPTAAMFGMFLYMGVKGIRDLVVTRRLIVMFKRRKHWKDHEYLRDIPPSVLKSFEILQLGLIVSMFSMNCITEFLGISWSSFLIPVMLLSYAVCRETVLPRLHMFAPHLDKLDPRHYVQMAAICRSERPNPKTLLVPPPSDSGTHLGSSAGANTVETLYGVRDSANTSGDEVSSSSNSDLDR